MVPTTWTFLTTPAGAFELKYLQIRASHHQFVQYLLLEEMVAGAQTVGVFVIIIITILSPGDAHEGMWNLRVFLALRAQCASLCVLPASRPCVRTLPQFMIDLVLLCLGCFISVIPSQSLCCLQ